MGARAFGPGSRTFLSERAGFSRRIRRPHPGLSRGEREQTAVGTLSASFRAEPDPAQVKRLLGMLDTTKDDVAQRTTIFWLGLVGKNDPAVKERLLTVFRTNKVQNVREASAEALGMMGIQEAGEMPRMSETEQQELEKARKNVKT